MILVVFQILLWLILGRPQPSETTSHWQRALTRNLYILFYACVIILGISGFFQATASGVSIKFWGLPIPVGKGEDADLAKFYEALHEISALALVVLVVIWVGVILLKTYQQNKIFYGKTLSHRIKSKVASPPLSKAILRLVKNLRLLGWMAFWIQFGLAIAAALLLLFTTSGQSLSPNELSSGLTWAVYDFIILCLTTLFFFYYTRLAKKITLEPDHYINLKKKSSPWFLRLSYKTSLLGMLVSFIGIGTRVVFQIWRFQVYTCTPNSYRLIKSPMTISCIWRVLEKQIVLRANRLMRVRKVRCFLSIFWVCCLPMWCLLLSRWR